jgi:hypothetical protein
VSLLKKAVGEYHCDEELPDLLEEQVEVYEPEAILAARAQKKQGEEVRQVLVHWKGKTVEEATWEDEMMIRSQFPKFDLEDKAIVEGGGVDGTQPSAGMPRDQVIHNTAAKPRILRVYSRRGKMGNAG